MSTYRNALELIARWPATGQAQKLARETLAQADTNTADLANVVRSFIAFQNAGYLAGQPFEGTYSLLVKDARTLLRELDA